MIIDKKSKQIISDNSKSVIAKEPQPVTPEVERPEQVEANGAADIIHAFMDMLKQVTWEYGVEGSPLIFKTVQRNDGQYNRIVRKNVGNLEEGIAFPAAFVHLINMHWNVTAQRFNDGMATLRVQFILNRLDTHNPEHDTEVYYVAERINQTVTLLKDNYPCLTKRCVLQYVDPMESFDNSLQPCWMTYDVYFTTVSVWISRNKTMRRIVIPPFTNHADQDQDDPKNNIFGHTNLDHKEETYDKHTSYNEDIPPEKNTKEEKDKDKDKKKNKGSK